MSRRTIGPRLPLEMAERCERLHLYAKAAAWRMKVLQIEPQHRPTHGALAVYYELSGQPHLAARHCALAAAEQ